MAERTSEENPHDLYNIIVTQKVIFEYTTWMVSPFLCQSEGP
jgi:hypothetical protein